MQRESREEMQQEALSRAVGGFTMSNWPAIFAGFAAKGIPESDIRPRENIFTYAAWQALGRQVRRGEHGVKVLTFVAIERESAAPSNGEATQADATAEKRKSRGRRPWSATVFHVSQTDAAK